MGKLKSFMDIYREIFKTKTINFVIENKNRRHFWYTGLKIYLIEKFFFKWIHFTSIILPTNFLLKIDEPKRNFIVNVFLLNYFIDKLLSGNYFLIYLYNKLNLFS